jgi:biopolymer transport protein ExbD
MAFAMRASHPMADMNITPLVDVMLVMLVIFMITLPALTNTLGVSLQPGRPDKATPIEPVRLHVDAGGTLAWNGTPVTLAELCARLADTAAPSLVADGVDTTRQPAVEIDADRAADYQLVAQVMASVDNAGLGKINLVQ